MDFDPDSVLPLLQKRAQNLILDLGNDDESLVDDSMEEESEMEKGLVNDEEEPSIEA